VFFFLLRKEKVRDVILIKRGKDSGRDCGFDFGRLGAAKKKQEGCAGASFFFAEGDTKTKRVTAQSEHGKEGLLLFDYISP